ncbi:MAG: EAL domain-containing protein [Rhodospirillales bacterium]|jgi:EAL domain-containing protein (putative c-di-GMP-specific phosphodiesterase class I)
MDRILIVDDEPQVLAGIRRAIGRQFDVDLATCADEALRLLSSGIRYSVILSDLSMAGGDGVTLLEQARSMVPSIPRILLTGYGDRNALLDAINRAGVSAFLQKPIRSTELLAALHKAIRNARPSTAEGLGALTPDQRWIAAELTCADLDRHFHLLLQPRIDATDGKLAAAEGLARWTHPQRGAISPAAFIPVVEAIGMIGALTTWALRQAGLAWRRLAAEGVDIPISVNVSGAANGTETLLNVVRSMLNESRMPSDRLEIEFTESHRLEGVPEIHGALAELRSLGVRTALDDFGVGYSSMDTLRVLDVDMLKIDRSFAAQLANDVKHREIVRSIVNLSRALRLGVVAEGVETLEQASLLYSLGVHQFQGFLFAPALTTPQLLQQWRPGDVRHDPNSWRTGAPIGGA